jgi:hypothetical protein
MGYRKIGVTVTMTEQAARRLFLDCNQQAQHTGYRRSTRIPKPEETNVSDENVRD